MSASDPIAQLPATTTDMLGVLVANGAPVIFSLGGMVVVAFVAMTAMRRIG